MNKNIFKNQWIYMLIIFISTYILFMNSDKAIITVGYNIIILILILVYSKIGKGRVSPLKVLKLTIFYLAIATTPILISNGMLLAINKIIWFIYVGYFLLELNIKDDEIGKKYPFIKIINLVYYSIMTVIRIFIYPILFIIVNAKRDRKKNKKIPILQIIIGLVVAIPIVASTVTLLILSDNGFLIIFSNLDVIDIVSAIKAFVFSLVLFSFFFSARARSKKYDKFLVELVNEKINLSNLKIFANIILLSLIPGYVLFIGYELKNIVSGNILFESISVNGFMYIIMVVIINIMLLIILYYFYEGKNMFSKIIRTLIVLINFGFLTIATSQLYIYIDNLGSLTYKRYYGLVIIVILILINLIFLIKTNKKSFVINVFFSLTLFITYIMVFNIDADSVIYKYNENNANEIEHIDKEYMSKLNPIWFINEYKNY